MLTKTWDILKQNLLLSYILTSLYYILKHSYLKYVNDYLHTFSGVHAICLCTDQRSKGMRSTSHCFKFTSHPFALFRVIARKLFLNQRGLSRFNLSKSDPFTNPLLERDNPERISKCLWPKEPTISKYAAGLLEFCSFKICRYMVHCS